MTLSTIFTLLVFFLALLRLASGVNPPESSVSYAIVGLHEFDLFYKIHILHCNLHC